MTALATERPQVEFDPKPDMCDAYRHEDGSITYIVYDHDGEHANPRDYDGNVATLIQENDRCIRIDEDEAGLSEARERFGRYGRQGWSTWRDPSLSRMHCHHDREYMMRRYIAMFRPDIVHYVDWWSAGDSYGWGYVTRADWVKSMYPERPYIPDDAHGREVADAIERFLDYEPGITPEKAFSDEVDLYRQWAEGEVYGGIHVTADEPIVVLGDHGAYVDGYAESEDSCWGFLGYDDHKEICAHFTDSPITEVLY